jgi:hypothetical protein
MSGLKKKKGYEMLEGIKVAQRIPGSVAKLRNWKRPYCVKSGKFLDFRSLD